MKRCCRCKELKASEDFCKLKSSPDGLHRRCKQCSKEALTLDYAKHREKRLAQKSDYYKNLPEDKREQRRIYHRDWQRQKVAALPKQWEVRDPSAWKSTRYQNWKARKLGVPGTITAEEWIAVCERYGSICLCCRKREPLTLDHIVPLTKGGLNTIDNVQPLCIDYRLPFESESAAPDS